MVSTSFQKPTPLLQPFVSCYALRQFNTGETVMPQPFHAINQCFLTFFLKDKFTDVKNLSGTIERFSSAMASAHTEPRGCVFYKGNFAQLSVQFKSNGFFAIFGIPQKNVVNTIIPLADILGSDERILNEQLESCKDISEMAKYLDKYLTINLLRQRHKSYTSTIAYVSNTIFQNKGIVSVDALSHEANMSFRNFERRFIEEVGIGPKLYARITRFFNALENKMIHPEKKWTDIVYENGFFDQAHFIKEVKLFSSKTPEELFRHTPPPKENFIE